jgi:hypothetical protein
LQADDETPDGVNRKRVDREIVPLAPFLNEPAHDVAKNGPDEPADKTLPLPMPPQMVSRRSHQHEAVQGGLHRHANRQFSRSPRQPEGASQ